MNDTKAPKPTSETRREFLKSSTFGVLATASLGPLTALADPTIRNSAGDISCWVTGGNSRFRPASPLHWQRAGKDTQSVITVDPEKQFQEILGFGAAFTDAACYMLNQLSTSAREQLLHDLFDPAAMGLSVCRVCMGASDYATHAYSYDDGEADPELKRFSIDHDREYILPILRQTRSLNPDLFLLATPWSPPGWMKSGGSMLGGSMRRRYLPQYAQYFLKFLQAYASEGVPIQAVTPQNEVDTDQDGRMPACIWPQEYEIEFVARYLGPLLEQERLSTKIWILDHNYNLWGRAAGEMENADLRKYCNSVAWHGYVGDPEMVTRVHNLHPDVNMFWTEGGPDYTRPDYATDWANWGQMFTGILRNWCRSITAWNFALDEKGRPNIGPFPCGGLVTIHSETKAITQSGQYWAFAHFSSVIKRGARRIDSQGSLPEVAHAAFQNPDGSKALILTNPREPKTVACRFGTSQTQVALERDSITTLAWS